MNNLGEKNNIEKVSEVFESKQETPQIIEKSSEEISTLMLEQEKIEVADFDKEGEKCAEAFALMETIASEKNLSIDLEDNEELKNIETEAISTEIYLREAITPPPLPNMPPPLPAEYLQKHSENIPPPLPNMPPPLPEEYLRTMPPPLPVEKEFSTPLALPNMPPPLPAEYLQKYSETKPPPLPNMPPPLPAEYSGIMPPPLPNILGFKAES